jgi:hypothetical protein
LATFALRAGISTFDLSRYMGASLTMIDRHYGHLARDGREHAIRLLDELSAGKRPRWTLLDAAWTSTAAPAPAQTTATWAEQEKTLSPLTDSNRRPLLTIESLGNGGRNPKSSDRGWTPVLAMVFPQGSLEWPPGSNLPRQYCPAAVARSKRSTQHGLDRH